MSRTRIPSGEICYRCGKKAELRDRDNKGNWTKKYVCKSHWHKDYNKEYCKNYGSQYLADYKIGNLDPDSETGKGYIFQKVTCKARGVKDLNIENNNFHSPIDHSIDPELGIIQSKSAIYNQIEETWTINVESEQGKNFDNIIVYCISSDKKTIERVYVIPWKEIIGRISSIGICKNPLSSRGPFWYEKYRVKYIKVYNDAYQDILKDIEEGKDPILRRK